MPSAAGRTPLAPDDSIIGGIEETEGRQESVYKPPSSPPIPTPFLLQHQPAQHSKAQPPEPTAKANSFTALFPNSQHAVHQPLHRSGSRHDRDRPPGRRQLQRGRSHRRRRRRRWRRGPRPGHLQHQQPARVLRRPARHPPLHRWHPQQQLRGLQLLLQHRGSCCKCSSSVLFS